MPDVPSPRPLAPEDVLLAAERARIQRRTLAVLSASQVLGSLGIGVGFAVATLVAKDLTGSASLAGSPVMMLTLGSAAISLPLARRAATKGRRAALSLGWWLAAVGAAITAGAILLGWFPLALLGFVCLGAATSANLQARFAATDLAEPHVAGRSLSLVVWATTIGSVAGPNLSEPARSWASALGLPGLAGPFVLGALGFAIAGAILATWLRPDPLRTAQALSGAMSPRRPTAGPLQVAEGWAAIRASKEALVSLLLILVGQAVMVAVMAMTPVHLVEHGASLRIVGFTISMHVAGMYALSPVFGWLADKWGRRQVMLLGLGGLAAAVLAAGTAGGRQANLVVGLALLGLGWSAATVSGSTALAEAVPLTHRPAAQGLTDSLTGLSGALAAAASGLLLATMGFGGLNLVAGMLLLPAVAAVVIAVPPRPTGS